MDEKPKRKNDDLLYPENTLTGSLRELEIVKRELWQAIDETYHIEDKLIRFIEWLAKNIQRLSGK